MIKHINLKDGTTVNIDTNVTLNSFLRAQDEGYFSENLLSTIMGISSASNDPLEYLKHVKDKDLLNALYVSYLNANPNGMSISDFNTKINLDFELCMGVFSDIIMGGINSKPQLAHDFEKSTKNKQKSKKKYQNSKER